VIEPTEELLARAARQGEEQPPAAGADAERRRQATTADGVRILLDANIEFPEDLAAARYAGAEGIGLYRSEFLLASATGELAREVDFFTIGTNDLIQYCLAVDRADERVSRLYEPLHPAILRVILMVRRAAARQRMPVSVCGEMASDPALLMLLVGLGLTEFSMTPGAIPVAKQVLSELRSADLKALARRILRLSTIDDIERELLAVLGRGVSL